jgi:hypothetical protein
MRRSHTVAAPRVTFAATSSSGDLPKLQLLGPTCSTRTLSEIRLFALAQLGCAPQIIKRKRPKCFGHSRLGTLAGNLRASFGQLLVVLRSGPFHGASLCDLRFRQV